MVFNHARPCCIKCTVSAYSVENKRNVPPITLILPASPSYMLRFQQKDGPPDIISVINHAQPTVNFQDRALASRLIPYGVEIKQNLKERNEYSAAMIIVRFSRHNLIRWKDEPRDSEEACHCRCVRNPRPRITYYHSPSPPRRQSSELGTPTITHRYLLEASNTCSTVMVTL